MNYSYFLIKPDGIRYLKEIDEIINSKKFDRIIYFAVNDWEKVQKDLYEEHYKKKDFADSYQAFVEAEKNLFGNRGIIILVSKKEGTYQELMDKVLSTKLEIRKRLAYKVGLVRKGKKRKEIKRPRKFEDKHKIYRLSYLDVIHCPDPKKAVTLKELNKLFKKGIISVKNIISPKILAKIKKYKISGYLEELEDEQIETSEHLEDILQEIGEDGR